MPTDPSHSVLYVLSGLFLAVVYGYINKYLVHPRIDKYIAYRATRKNENMEKEYLKTKDLHNNNQKILTRIMLEVSMLSFVFAVLLIIKSLTEVFRAANPGNPGITLIQYGAYFAFAVVLIQRTMENANLHWRINNFSEYEGKVREKLGHVPKSGAEAALPG